VQEVRYENFLPHIQHNLIKHAVFTRQIMQTDCNTRFFTMKRYTEFALPTSTGHGWWPSAIS